MGGLLASVRVVLPWIHIALRIIQTVFALVVLGLSGSVAHWYNADTLTRSPPQINFLLFVPIFSILSIVGLEVSRMKKISIPMVNLGVELLNTLFHFVGFVSLSAFLSKLLFCRGSVCMSARADAAIAGLAWVAWAGSCAISSIAVFRGNRALRLDNEAAIAMKTAPPAIPEKN